MFSIFRLLLVFFFALMIFSNAALSQSTVSEKSHSDNPISSQNSTINISVLGTYETGIYDGSAAEVSAYDSVSKTLFVVNGANT